MKFLNSSAKCLESNVVKEKIPSKSHVASVLSSAPEMTNIQMLAQNQIHLCRDTNATTTSSSFMNLPSLQPVCT